MKNILIFLLLHISIAFAKTVYFVPYPGANPQMQFFHANSDRDEFAKKWVELRKALENAGYTVKFTFDGKGLEDVTAIISITNVNPTLLANLSSYPKEKCFLLVMEPPVFMPHIYDEVHTKIFSKIFVMFDDLVDNKRYFKFYYPQPRQEMYMDLPDFSKRKLCVVIAGNKDFQHPQALYSARRDTIAFFSNLKNDELDLFGPGWDGYPQWKGITRNKWKTYNNYKFSICYENMKDQVGYITEKIFDCFVGGCVPVYWGASNIQDYVPKKCFIDRREFSSEQELYSFLKNMKKETYNDYIRSTEKYFKTSKAQLFSINNFIKIIKHHLDQIE